MNCQNEVNLEEIFAKEAEFHKKTRANLARILYEKSEKLRSGSLFTKPKNGMFLIAKLESAEENKTVVLIKNGFAFFGDDVEEQSYCSACAESEKDQNLSWYTPTLDNVEFVRFAVYEEVLELVARLDMGDLYHLYHQNLECENF